MKIFGWLWKLLRMMMQDEGSDGARGRNVARPNAYGHQRIRAGSPVRLTAGEWRGEEAIVDTARSNGDLTVTLTRTGRKLNTGTNKVEVLSRTSQPNQTRARKGMDIRINEGDHCGRVATVTEVTTDGRIYAKITGGSTEQNSDPDSLRGKEIRVWEHQVTLIGR